MQYDYVYIDGMRYDYVYIDGMQYDYVYIDGLRYGLIYLQFYQTLVDIIVYISDIGDYDILLHSIHLGLEQCTWDKYSPRNFLDNILLNFVLICE